MMIIEQIKQDQVAARIARDQLRTSLLTTVLGEAETAAKNKGQALLSDQDTIALLKKFIDNIKTTIEYCEDNYYRVSDERYENAVAERMILEKYMPVALTEEQLSVIIKVFADQGLNMGQIMQRLKEGYAGQYDGAKASALVKSVLK